jgi:hypothetical protein
MLDLGTLILSKAATKPQGARPLRSGRWKTVLASRSGVLRMLLLYFTTDGAVDAPLVAAHRLTPIPFLPALKGGVSWEVFL